jgi:hypothetical protein
MDVYSSSKEAQTKFLKVGEKWFSGSAYVSVEIKL